MGSAMSIRTGEAFDVKGAAVVVERKRHVLVALAHVDAL